MTGTTPNGIRHPDGATRAKDLGPELQQMAEDIDKFIDDSLDASSPGFKAAAKTAVDAIVPGAVGDAVDKEGLLSLRKLGAVRTLDINDPLYSEVRMTYDFRRIGGTLRGGGEVGVNQGAAESVLPVGAGTVDMTRDYRRAEPGADHTGLTPQAVLNEWAGRMPAGASLVALTGWGDSMTTDHGGLGTNQTLTLAAALGVAGYDRGGSGDTATQVAWRMGALPWRITVPGGTIPAAGETPATITPALGHRSTRAWPCTLTDRSGQPVSVILRHTEATPDAAAAFTVEQVAGTAPRTVLPGTRIAHEQTHDRPAATAPATFWVGRNDVHEGRVITALAAMLAQHRDPARRVLVRPIFNKSDEPAGSVGYVSLMAVNAAIAQLAGQSFYDDRAALIAHGLTIAGIAPTPDDTAAISQDRIPPSLMSDTIHLNVAGRQALARLDAIEIQGRNW